VRERALVVWKGFARKRQGEVKFVFREGGPTLREGGTVYAKEKVTGRGRLVQSFTYLGEGKGTWWNASGGRPGGGEPVGGLVRGQKSRSFAKKAVYHLVKGGKKIAASQKAPEAILPSTSGRLSSGGKEKGGLALFCLGAG